jgi:hypothetical protein
MVTETTRRRRELAYLLIEREQLIHELGTLGFGPQKQILQRSAEVTKWPVVTRIFFAINDLIHRPTHPIVHGA